MIRRQKLEPGQSNVLMSENANFSYMSFKSMSKQKHILIIPMNIYNLKKNSINLNKRGWGNF